MSVKLEIEISEEEYDLLIRCKEKGYLEYKDCNKTLEEYIDSWRDINNHTDEILRKQYLHRNEDNTYEIAEKLWAIGLIQWDYDAWHQTFVLTPLSRKILKK